MQILFNVLNNRFFHICQILLLKLYIFNAIHDAGRLVANIYKKQGLWRKSE